MPSGGGLQLLVRSSAIGASAMVDGVIVTVVHDEFRGAGLSDMAWFMAMGETPVLVDVRGMFDRAEAERRGIYYRKL